MDKTLQALQKANPRLAMYTVHGPEFRPYGRPLSLDTAEFCRVADASAEWPAEGSLYLAAVRQLDTLAGADAFRAEYCGQLDEQFGFCWGHSNTLNALEWHTCSEFNIATRPLVLLLAKRGELEGKDERDYRLDSARVRAFYLAKGDAVEVYADTLHFCPCEVSRREGFGCVVALARGTNQPLDEGAAGGPLLWAKNKWLLAHEANAPLLARGAAGRIYGENWTIHPID